MKRSSRRESLPSKAWPGRVVDVRLQLLDHQILSDEYAPLGTVDDVELDGVPFDVDIAAGTAAPAVVSLVTGRALVTRIFGGRPPESRLERIAVALVRRIGTAIYLRPMDQPLDSMWTEQWLRSRLIGRIPGGQHHAGK